MTFVDTGAWVEAEIGAGDAADHIRRELRSRARELATSTPVLTEVWMVLAVRAGTSRARHACLDLAASTDVLTLDTDAHEHAFAIMRQWSDQSFSYADASSFALMIRERIDVALTLDQHFRVFRYGRDRRRALHVLP